MNLLNNLHGFSANTSQEPRYLFSQSILIYAHQNQYRVQKKSMFGLTFEAHYIAKKRLQEGCCKTRLRSLKIRLFAHSKKNTTDFSMGFNIIVIESINDTLCRF